MKIHLFSPLWTFAVCTVHFVVMFTLSGGPNKTKHSYYAYVSRSTRNLRSLLKENVSILWFFTSDETQVSSSSLLKICYNSSLFGFLFICVNHLNTVGQRKKKEKLSCNSMLLQGVLFSMPLCHSKVEEVTAEDLVELAEIEKNNFGQVRILFFFLNGILWNRGLRL